jgi:hypothetical protein
LILPASSIQGLDWWPVPASMNSHPLRCVTGFLLPWAYEEEPASPLFLFPSFTHVQANTVRLLTLSFIENTPNSILISLFLILSSLVHPLTDLSNRISAVCYF